jgi:putative endonuclease
MASAHLTHHAAGLHAEDIACAALASDGWTIRARRLRTPAGEIDVIAEKSGLLAIVEVKQRATLYDAAFALTERQKTRLIGACEIVLSQHPDWGSNGTRFDLMVVDRAGRVRRISDAFHADR